MARGSTLVNILQQIGGSVGAAVMSVILTNELNGSRPIPGLVDESGKPVTEAGLAIASQQRPELLQQMPVDPSLIERGLDFAAKSFASTFWVAFALVVLTITRRRSCRADVSRRSSTTRRASRSGRPSSSTDRPRRARHR